ncbi:MAG: TIGR03936 family radical SAM-associated protein [Eubacteriales bacterium]|jgi:radical SAM-linked protein
MRQIRLIFQKEREARYISHLDLNRVFMRGLMLSGIPVKCTEGFNPRPYLVFGAPLPLGFSGWRETLDIGVLDDEMSFEEMVGRFQGALPIGVEVIAAQEVVRKNKEIWFGSYRFQCEGIEDPDAVEKIRGLLNGESLVIRKRTKRGEKELDLVGLLPWAEWSMPAEGVVECACVLPLNGENSVSPQLLTQALTQHLPQFRPTYERYERLGFLTQQRENFVQL